MADRFDLERFLLAQDQNFDATGSVFSRAYAELRVGKKRNHWMWFIFPQIHGLGQSAMSVKYAISGREEARAYLDHPVLGFRLRECASLVNQQDKDPQRIFGQIDAVKFHSSMTLFSAVSNESHFNEAVLKYFDNIKDPNTMQILSFT
jgi:uncharacterized protein (DUF1810 family)